MRGEFHLGRGESQLVLPNNMSLEALKWILGFAFTNDYADYTGDLWVGLCDAVPSLTLTHADIEEPTIGVNGYARIPLVRESASWPTSGVSNNEPYIETETIVLTPTGAGFDKGITRMFLAFSQSGTAGSVFSLSAALPEPVVLTPSNIDDYNFKYRIYN